MTAIRRRAGRSYAGRSVVRALGNFQILAAHKELDALKQLADYVIPLSFSRIGRAVDRRPMGWFAEMLPGPRL